MTARPDPDLVLQAIAKAAGLTLYVERPANLRDATPCLVATPGDGDHRPGAWQAPTWDVWSCHTTRKAARDQALALAEAIEHSWRSSRINTITERGLPIPIQSDADGLWVWSIRTGFQVRH